ncbi:mucin-associated surface protein (MASP), putative, partial [Trypanosoma cruzi]
MHAQRSPVFFNFGFLILVSYCFLNFWFAEQCASSAI